MVERRRRWPFRAAAAVALLAPVGCGSDDAPTGGPTGPRAREDADILTTDLAPSQVTASTVARPDTPPPCDPADIVTWTASVDVDADGATAVVRLRNDGDVWCEIDLRESPRIDSRTEPDLWLEPGDWGDLWIGPDETATCDRPKPVVAAEIAILDQVRSVPTAAVVPCEWTITAMYGVDPPEISCEGGDLVAIRVADEIVVRNTSFTSCVLGSLIEVDGAPTFTGVRSAPVEISALAAGDTVAYPAAPGATDCVPAEASARFDAGAEVVVQGLRTCDRVGLGAGVPFYDGPTGPLAGFPATLDELGWVAARVALDPFSAP